MIDCVMIQALKSNFRLCKARFPGFLTVAESYPSEHTTLNSAAKAGKGLCRCIGADGTRDEALQATSEATHST